MARRLRLVLAKLRLHWWRKMPVKRTYEGCPEMREYQTPGQFGCQGTKVCGRPIYMNGVCDQCYRCKESLREGGYTPMQATGGVSERMNSNAYKRLYVEDDTLAEKGVDRDVESAMKNFEDEASDLLG